MFVRCLLYLFGVCRKGDPIVKSIQKSCLTHLNSKLYIFVDPPFWIPLLGDGDSPMAKTDPDPTSKHLELRQYVDSMSADYRDTILSISYVYMQHVNETSRHNADLVKVLVTYGIWKK